jgi:hypothetical protein
LGSIDQKGAVQNQQSKAKAIDFNNQKSTVQNKPPKASKNNSIDQKINIQNNSSKALTNFNNNILEEEYQFFRVFHVSFQKYLQLKIIK